MFTFSNRYLRISSLGTPLVIALACSPANESNLNALNDALANPNATEESDSSIVSSENAGGTSSAGSYPIVDTAQHKAYDNNGNSLGDIDSAHAYYGQDANYQGFEPSYQDNQDGTVTDLVTGLMWQQDPGEKVSWQVGINGEASFELAGHDDWRVPTIKELYSLIKFNGELNVSTGTTVPYIDTEYFLFQYGDESAGERLIDSQYMTSTVYTGSTMNSNKTMFGVNFADGRIKGYPTQSSFFLMHVRGNTSYGYNQFVDNGDNTISDEATGLMWMTLDSGHLGEGGMIWSDALSWAESLEYANYSDWRLPNPKELQSIVDYTRSPASHGTAAIDPLFECSSIIDEGGESNFPFFWTGTSHLDGLTPGSFGIYLAFGEALGYMSTFDGSTFLTDVHGAGCQRSDPKSGDPEDYSSGHGPQGDVVRIYNYVRCVRDISSL
ncbi:MAG: DUF1566 domain-containing protein [Planctomycetes bacterium]|nr:DUF1566 domain-containing protein [Planctomycetota bacterium]